MSNTNSLLIDKIKERINELPDNHPNREKLEMLIMAFQIADIEEKLTPNTNECTNGVTTPSTIHMDEIDDAKLDEMINVWCNCRAFNNISNQT